MSKRLFVCARCHQHQHQHQLRSFSTTVTRPARPRTSALSLLPEHADAPPPYPFGPARWYKQRNQGLYGNASIQFGNYVSDKFKTKARRTWLPNIVTKKVYSPALGSNVRVKISTRVLRTIDKVGGLDEYLVGSKTARLRELGEEGWKLRWAVLHTPWGQERIKTDPALRHSMQLINSVRSGQTDIDEEVELATGEYLDRIEEPKMDAADVQERIQRRLEESTHMSEAPTPSIWTRMKGLFAR